ncbi:hypothetical protein ASPZODRAFT_146023 [Penicilliopsis zonata CBS 506.65]|uniref:BZIP domain-containing protein n=1 Tax=Penicilliopsis zonata CBS 506.65 TaxID=1073090 RepID=A0A1L9S946_9EURO|nr:hypothetical protein ASPZODRAFT_146023 [Penicilliopsis zonata CBS 506.65]OJJ43681.1 hypothetical protein ASPZODRAFT_146023 [Penicilliopsis zonata CBS 506.65]
MSSCEVQKMSQACVEMKMNPPPQQVAQPPAYQTAPGTKDSQAIYQNEKEQASDGVHVQDEADDTLMKDLRSMLCKVLCISSSRNKEGGNARPEKLSKTIKRVKRDAKKARKDARKAEKLTRKSVAKTNRMNAKVNAARKILDEARNANTKAKNSVSTAQDHREALVKSVRHLDKMSKQQLEDSRLTLAKAKAAKKRADNSIP